MSFGGFFNRLVSGRSSTRHVRSGLYSTTYIARKMRDRDDAGQLTPLTEDRLGPIGYLYCLFLIAATTFILDFGVLPPTLKERTLLNNSISARHDFQYNDPYEAKNMIADAERKAPRVYTEVPNWTNETLKDLTELIGIVENAKKLSDAIDRSSRYPSEKLLVEELFKYQEIIGKQRNFLGTILLDRIKVSLQKRADEGILSDDDLNKERNKPGEIKEIIRVAAHFSASASVNSGSTRKTDLSGRVKVETLLSIGTAYDQIRRSSWTENIPSELERHLLSHLLSHLNANLILDVLSTAKEAERARDYIGTGDVRIHKGDVLVSKGTLVGRSEIDKLHLENIAYKASLPQDARIRHLAGLATFAFAMVMLFIFIIQRTQQGIFRCRRALFMLGMFSIFVLLVIKGLLLAGYSLAFAPFVFIAIITSLAFGQTLALLTLCALMLLSIAAGMRWDASPVEVQFPALALALMLGGVASALPPERLKDRRDLLRYAAIGGAVQFVLTLGLCLLGGVGQSLWISASQQSPVALGIPTLHDALIALVNAPVCGLLVLGGLPIIEWLFGILTNIRLFELADMNQPALRRIQTDAPGTFAHTLQVRNLAEPAADAIGANTRLVSAGVLYHDLGKTLKPEYFVENQMNAEERHSRLRPSVSTLLITAHVKDGMELAHEYGLPNQIIDFIPEHHGTTLVSYFYHTAKKNAESAENASDTTGHETDTVQEAFFRYPGPKPQSRETAIVMLADTVEAATRTLDNPSAARLRTFIHELIMNKMLDNQLDECDLTFAELMLVEAAFLRVLVSRFHSRIKYPGQMIDTPAEIKKNPQENSHA